MREVDAGSFAATLDDGTFVLDVRDSWEYRRGHIAGATLIPLGELGQRLADLPRDVPIYVVCERGNRSLIAANALAGAGYDAYSVAGGMAAWQQLGHSVVSGDATA